MSKEFTVTWEIQIGADDPVDAARKALEVQRDKRSLAEVFEVWDEDGERYDIDLQDDSNA